MPMGGYYNVRVSELVILIGAVDNNKSRQLCHRMFYRATELIYIDSGNGEFTGQVRLQAEHGGIPLRQHFGLVLPQIGGGKVLPHQVLFLHHVAVAEDEPHRAAANITAATIVVDMVYNILATGSSTVRKVTFSTQTVNVRPELQKTSTRRKQAA